MRITKSLAKIVNACAKGSGRYGLNHPALVEHDGRKWIAATDGKIAVMRLVCATDGDVLGSLPIEAVQAAGKVKDPRGALVEANGHVTVPMAGLTLARPDGCFPNMSAIVPKPRDGARRLTFNASLMIAVLKALDPDDDMQRITLEIPEKDTHPFTLTTANGDIGLLMPITLTKA